MSVGREIDGREAEVPGSGTAGPGVEAGAGRILEVVADILVVGGGPAGMAAAAAAAARLGRGGGPGWDDAGPRVWMVDSAVQPGGQIWRVGVDDDGGVVAPANQRAYEALRATTAQVCGGWRIVDAPRRGTLLAVREATAIAGTGETKPKVARFHYQRLILATGARERFLPFPGWTLPGVFGVGGLQALVKGGWNVRGKRVVVSGTGPLLLAAAAHLAERGAVIVCVVEQAPVGRLARLAGSLWRQPGKLLQGLRYRISMGRAPFYAGCWVTEAVAGEGVQGRAALRGVMVTDGRRSWEERCDLLASGFHLVANTELAALLGCELREGVVRVDARQQTSVPGVFCAGEPTGVAGLEAALVSGRVAGLAAAERLEEAERLGGRNRRKRSFGRRLDRAFALRTELRSLGRPETIVCRCEDVRLGQLAAYTGWTEAKLQTRCGMGTCQGRVCGPALETIFGWRPTSIRPPLFPMPIAAWSAAGADAPAPVYTEGN